MVRKLIHLQNLLKGSLFSLVLWRQSGFLEHVKQIAPEHFGAKFMVVADKEIVKSNQIRAECLEVHIRELCYGLNFALTLMANTLGLLTSSNDCCLKGLKVNIVILHLLGKRPNVQSHASSQ